MILYTSIIILSLMMALGFSFSQSNARFRWGLLSFIFLMILLFFAEESPNEYIHLSKAVCLCTSGIWLSECIENIRSKHLSFYGRGYISLLITRLSPLALIGFVHIYEGSLYIERIFHLGDPFWFCLCILIVSSLVLADSLFRAIGSGWHALYLEYRQGSLLLLSLSFAGAFTEEALFRGVLLKTLIPFGIQPIPLVSSAILFGLFHFKKGNPSGWPGICKTALLGCLLGIIVLQSKSIFPAAIVHGLGAPYMIRLYLICKRVFQKKRESQKNQKERDIKLRTIRF